MNISYPLIRTRLCGNQGVRNVSFLDNFAYKLNERSQEQINFAKKKKKKKKKKFKKKKKKKTFTTKTIQCSTKFIQNRRKLQC